MKFGNLLLILLALSAKESGYWLHALPSANLGTMLDHTTLSAGGFSRHSTINDIIRRSLATAHVPAVLEPINLARSDGKIPDGMTLIPWRLGRSLLWDATCVDTLAASHIQANSSMVGAAATSAEQAKRSKYEKQDSR
ncbi:jg26185 [Pararge aegeria aegeria]|uniref:Jg26185 protein n=1 Tax=Pararge aegeria aegeria TaxID=348720 RepID=A0A8S4R115_9NEOP|nr:jg26185 [Pararge aegeria aegeria]